MKKCIIGITIISILLLGMLTYQQCKDDIPGTDTVSFFTETSNATTYISQNGDEAGCIYKIDQKGKVLKFVTTNHEETIKNMSLKAMAYEEHLYALYQEENKFSLVLFNDDLSINKVININTIVGDKVSEMVVYQRIVFFTVLTDYYSTATVYSLDTSTENAEVQAVLKTEAPKNRHFTKTEYDGKKLTALYDNGSDERSDSEKVQPTVFPDTMGKILVALAMNENTVLLFFFFFFSLLMLVVVLILVLLKSRSYGLQRFASLEAILIFILMGSMMINYDTTVKTLKTDKMQYAKYQADSLMNELAYYNQLDTEDNTFCDSEQYENAYETLFSFVKNKNLESFVENVLIVGINSNKCVEEVSLDGYYGKNIEDMESQELNILLETAITRAESTERLIRYKGREYGTWIIIWPNTIAQSKLLITLVPLDEVSQISREYLSKLCFYGSLLWLIGTLLLGTVSYFEFRSVRKLSKTMESVCQGKQTSFKKPKVMNWDLERMWNSLYEIFKNRERLFYSKNVIFKAYYRFTPKNIEKILGKESIADVKIGDSIEMTAIAGTIAMTGIVGLTSEEYIRSMNFNFDTISHYLLDYEGVTLSSDYNLGSMKVLFDTKVHNAMQFSVDAIIALQEAGALEAQKTMIFLHEGNVVYGVAGTDEQAFPYVISREFDCMQQYVPRLRDMGVRIIVTDKVHINMESSIASRYIGYIELTNVNRNVKLYEILDAYPVKEKNLRIANAEAFQKALNLYYKNDFYLARNMFTEVVKNVPTDQVAKWYLFTCEKMLNSTETSSFKYGLFSE